MAAQIEHSHYEVLGVRVNATYQQIKNAFNRKALQYHPDKQVKQQQTTQSQQQQQHQNNFLLIQEAYSVLKDVAKRNQYDLQRQSIENHQKQREEPLIYEEVDLDDMDYDEADESYSKSCFRCQSSLEESGI